MHPFKLYLMIFGSVVAGLVIGFFAADRAGIDGLDGSEVSTGTADQLPPISGTGGSTEEGPVETPYEDLSSEEKLAAIDASMNSRSLDNSIRILELIAAMSVSELEAVLAKVEESVGHPANYQETLIPFHVFNAWVEKDPQGAFRYFLNMSDPMLQGSYAGYLFGAWTAKDPDGALAAMRGIEDGNMRIRASSLIISSIAADDPDRALDLMAELEATSDYQLRTIFSLWTRQNPDAAMARVQAMEPGSGRTSALQGVIQSVAKQDGERAVAMAMSLQNEEERIKALRTGAYAWMLKDTEAAIQFMSQIEDSALKNEVLPQLLGEVLSRKDPKRAFELARSHLTGKALDLTRHSILNTASQRQPQVAAQIASEMPFGWNYTQAISMVAQRWGRTDPVAALEWADSLDEGKERRQALASILRDFSRHKTEEAHAYLNTMPEGSQREELANNLAWIMAEDDPQAALSWADSFEDAGLKKQLKDQAIKGWVSRDPQAAVAYLNSTGDSSQMKEYANTIAQYWFDHDPQEAARWAQSVDDEAKSNAVAAVAQKWLHMDTKKASEWIAELEPGEPRDRAVKSLVDVIDDSEPESAFAWATTIQEPIERFKSIYRVVHTMKRLGKSDRAVQLVEDTELSPDQKVRLLKLVTRIPEVRGKKLQFFSEP